MHLLSSQLVAGLGLAAALFLLGNGRISTHLAPQVRPADVAAAHDEPAHVAPTAVVPPTLAPVVEPAAMPEPPRPLVGRLEERSFYSPILGEEEPYLVY